MTSVVKAEHNRRVDISPPPPHADFVSARKYDWSSFAGRVAWIVEEKFGGNESALAEAAGLKNRTNINRAIKRGSVMRADNAAAVARAAGVSLYWLAGSAPDPYSGVQVDDTVDIFPYRREAIELARRKKPRRITEGAIARARALEGSEHSAKSRADWAELLWEYTLEELQSSMRDEHERRKTPPAPAPAPEKPASKRKTA